MTVLQVLNTLYRRLADPDAIVRVDIDRAAHEDQCKLVIISDQVYAAGIVDASDWSTPDNLIEAALQHFATCRAGAIKSGQSPHISGTGCQKQ